MPLKRVEPAHKQIAQAIRNQILAGVLRDGQALPSTRKLAQEWDVSVFTISQAMKILAEENLVSNHDRSKRVVTAPESDDFTELKLPQPIVVLIGGFSGSGKSEFARVLTKETRWGLIDKDTVSRHLAEKILTEIGQPPNDRESTKYFSSVRPLEYLAISEAVIENLECSSSVISTAPFLVEFASKKWLDSTIKKHAQLGAKTKIVWIHCDPETMHKYLKQRNADRDEYKLANWDAYLESIDIDARPATNFFEVDNSSGASSLLSQARKLLAELRSEH